MIRGLIGGMLAGGIVSVAGIGATSLLTELPANAVARSGTTPDTAGTLGIAAPADAPPTTETAASERPFAAVPEGDAAEATNVNDAPDPVETTPLDDDPDGAEGGSAASTPVGSLEIVAPVAPEVPQDTPSQEPAVEQQTPEQAEPEADAPRADTDPLDEPRVTAIEGAMQAPQTSETSDLQSGPVEPVLPNPQSLAPVIPNAESDVTVSTSPAAPTVVVVPEEPSEDVAVQSDQATDVASGEATEDEMSDAPSGEEFFVIDLGADRSDGGPQPSEDSSRAADPVEPEQVNPDVTDPEEGDTQIATLDRGEEASDAPRVLLQGGENSLMTGRDTGVTIRRPGTEGSEDETPDSTAESEGGALASYSAEIEDVSDRAILSIVLIDDGSMSAASAALAGLPFSVTIAVDPSVANAADLMKSYRAAGYEVVVMAKLPEGALPSDVEITFESVFSSLPETIAVLDLGAGGLQSDREVTAQAMDILASQGRGFISVPQGLNMAGRAADAAGVPSVEVYRDLDADDQDARVVRRFVDQAAFRARQESGVVLVGRVRPDTISALILWGAANQDERVAIVPVSAILRAQ